MSLVIHTARLPSNPAARALKISQRWSRKSHRGPRRENLFVVDATSARPFVATSTSRGTLVTLSGEFDLVTVREVAGQVDALLATAPSNVLMDMAALEFIDSSGIALLLKIYARVVTEGCGTLRVVNASDAARRTLELCGLTEAFGVDAAS